MGRWIRGAPLALLLGVAIITLLCGAQWARVTEVVDGDTVYVTSARREEKVRLIGIDAPEIHHPTRGKELYGKEATAYARKLVKPGDTVKLELDAEKRDRYGRLLAYVYLRDGRMLNAELLRGGYAQATTYPPNVKYVATFRRLQRQARQAGRGLWAKPLAVTAAQAGQWPGRYGTVRGRVRGVRVNHARVWLDLDGGFTCLLYDTDLVVGPPQALQGRELEVRGVIRSRQGLPEMRLEERDQLRVVAPAPVTPPVGGKP